ncbi:hypothetical protein Pvag_pPag20005 (plasmid) [Pantoea vagans C9-1]|nr:hypothetical protein Pvag_pPag20005 [Pantoea vagans C9-1]
MTFIYLFLLYFIGLFQAEIPFSSAIISNVFQLFFR